jgi:hypothetical protein
MNGFDPDDSKNWITVRYLSPFYGKTYGQAASSGFGNYPNNPVSYGEWHSPPDVGTQVICIFVNGDMNYGYYIGCIPEPEALTMVPAIGSVKTQVILNEGEAESLAGATQLPVTNINTANENMSNNSDFLNAPKPVHSYVSSVLAQQGLIRDTVRGTITTSSQRETPSRVGWGVSSPGRPIYEGGYTDATVTDALQGEGKNLKIISRRAGHSIVMDDGDLLGKDQLIRLRTSLGHQILMSDDGQCLFIIHANGQSWIELGKEGTIDMFATNSVNIRTQGDLNLHADNDVNIQADKNINIKAKENLTINTDKDFETRVGANFKQQTLEDHALLVNGKLALSGAGESSLASDGTTYINGSVVNLNTGSASLTPEEIKMMQMFAQSDTLFDKQKGFIPAPGKLETIASRAPAHHPWINAGQGVNVTTGVDADEELPEDASPEVEATNDEVPGAPDTPTNESLVSTVPNDLSASANLGPGTTASLVSSQAVQAATNIPGVASVGSAISEGQAKVGALAQSATQMVTGGTLKPGADRLINGLVQSGASVSGAMTSNMFTGANGVKSLASFTQSTGAQVNNMVSAISSTEKQLINTGLISGKQSPTQISGMILSGVQNGVGPTVDFVKNVSGGLDSTVKGLAGNLGGVNGKIAQSISAGNFASNLAMPGISLGGIGDLLAKVTSPLASAFNSIKDAYKNFKPNIPQDLTALAKSNTAETEAGQEVANSSEGVNPATGLVDAVGGAVGDITGAAKGLTTSAFNSLGSIPGSSGFNMGSISSIAGGATGLTKSLISNPVASGIIGAKNLDIAKTGLQGIPGGQNALSLVVNNASGAINKIPGADSLGSLINTNSSAALNGVAGSLMSSASKLQGLASGGIGGLTGGLPGTGDLLASAEKLGASLVPAATSILPAGLGNELQSAVKAIASSNPDKIKVPVVAENTVKRDSVDSQISSIIGDAKIPPPVYGDLQTKIQAQQDKLTDITKQLQREELKLDSVKQELDTASNNLPAGDPSIDQLKQKVESQARRVAGIVNEGIGGAL